MDYGLLSMDYGLLIMDHSGERVSERGVWKVDLASLFFFANVPRESFSKAFSTDGFRSAQDFMFKNPKVIKKGMTYLYNQFYKKKKSLLWW